MNGISEDLNEFWQISLTLVVFIVGLFVVKSIEKSNDDNLTLRLINWLVLVALCFWFLSYLFATKYELRAMGLVFDDSNKPPTAFFALLIGVGLAVGFAVLIIFHRNVFILAPVILLIAFIDIRGNQSLASGMQQILAKITQSGRAPTPAETIWFDYYLLKPQVTRIFIYAALSIFAFFFACLSLARHLKSTNLTGDGEVNRIVEWLKSKSFALKAIARLTIFSAIILNEAIMWNWRYERETALRQHCKSLYFAFLISDVGVLGAEACDSSKASDIVESTDETAPAKPPTE